MAGHSIGTSLLYYANHLEMRGSIGAGLLQEYQTQERVNNILQHETSSRPANSINGYFDKSFPIYSDPSKLPTANSFMQKYGTYEPDKVMFTDGVFVLYHCPVLSCVSQYLHFGDLVDHLTQSYNKMKCICVCGGCGNNNKYTQVPSFLRSCQ